MDTSRERHLIDSHHTDDKGVQFKHVSQELLNTLNTTDLGPNVTYLEDIPQTLAGGPLRYDPFGRELTVPSIYAELLSDDSERMRTVLAPVIQSEIEAHERTHEKLTRRERQWYVESEITSYQAILLGPRGYDQLIEFARKTAERTSADLTRSQLLHEGAAISAQLGHLREQGHHRALSWVTNNTATAQDIEQFLESGHDPVNYLTHLREDVPDSPLLSYPTHAFGHWLYEQLQSQWDLALPQYAFRMGGPAMTNQEETVGIVSPDTIAIVAAFADETVTRDRTSTEQRRELETLVQEWLDKNDFVASAGMADSDGDFSGNIEVLERDAVATSTRRILLTSAVDAEEYWHIPLYATDYPGVSSGKHLWAILRDFYVLTNPAGHRRLYLKSDTYEWARNTRLLSLAKQLWTLREKLFMPLFQAFNSATGHDINHILSMVHSDSIEPGLTTFDKSVAEDVAARQFNEAGGIDEDAYNDFIDDLAELGQAILTGDNDTVQTYLQ